MTTTNKQFAANVIAHSIGPARRALCTMQVTFPRIILAEMNTHRKFSRNAASSRAIPIAKMVEEVRTNLFIPEFGSHKPGMQAGELVADQEIARLEWIAASKDAVDSALALHNLGVAKQVVNRLLEPFSWTTVIITSTSWANFFDQRCSEFAQPEMRTIAEMMRLAYNHSIPTEFNDGDWHLPYVASSELEDIGLEKAMKASTARCSRVSYRHQDDSIDLDKDIRSFDKLSTSGHYSPFEHQAESNCHAGQNMNGNLGYGWLQHRKIYPQEYIEDLA